MPAHALILGCGRSGTSILGELSEPLLVDLPAIAPDETMVVKVPQVDENTTPPAGLPAAVLNRFEDMIGGPRTTADTMVRSIGIDPTTVAAELTAWSQRVQDTNNEHFVEAVTSRRHSRPDHSRRVGRWRENLTAEEVAAVLPIVAPAASRFGYDLPSSSS